MRRVGKKEGRKKRQISNGQITLEELVIFHNLFSTFNLLKHFQLPEIPSLCFWEHTKMSWIDGITYWWSLNVIPLNKGNSFQPPSLLPGGIMHVLYLFLLPFLRALLYQHLCLSYLLSHFWIHTITCVHRCICSTEFITLHRSVFDKFLWKCLSVSSVLLFHAISIFIQKKNS